MINGWFMGCVLQVEEYSWNVILIALWSDSVSDVTFRIDVGCLCLASF